MEFVNMEPGREAADRDRLHVMFYRRAVEVEDKTDENGMPVFEDRVFIKKLVPGDPTTIIDTFAKISGENGIPKRHPNADNNLFPKQWEAFQRGESGKHEGIPLAEFPALVDSQRRLLNHLEVYTVEELAELPDSTVSKVHGGNGMRQRAKDFLAARKDAAHTLKLSAELQKRDEKLSGMEAQLAEMTAKLEALQKSQKADKSK